MGSDRHRWGIHRQIGAIIACSISLTIFYACLDVGPQRESYRLDRPYKHLYNTAHNFSYYLVDSDTCKIPNLDPHHWSVRKFIENRSYVSCRNFLPHLVRLRRQETEDLPQFRLEVDKKAARKYYHGGVTCCYQEVHRVDGSDDKIRKDKEVCFKSSTTLSNTTQMVTVTCSKYFKTMKLKRKINVIYENMFYIILLTESVKAKIRNQEKMRGLRGTEAKTPDEGTRLNESKETHIQSEPAHRKEERESDKVGGFSDENLNGLADSQAHRDADDASKGTRQPADINRNDLKQERADRDQEEDLSLLIIGIDSVSRLNLIRAMPRTREFLDRNGWFELEGYNKIGDNTMPNLLALLSGRSIEDVKASCNPDLKSYFDECPMIWNDLSRKGYITSYAEDLAAISTFNYHKKGFRQQPTDYYWRPLLLAAEAGFKSKSMDSLHRYCVGSSIEAELLMEYTQRFVIEFQSYSYFSFVWMNAFSHNDVNTPSRMDKTVFRFLSTLNYTALNNTAVLFLSDHGIRFGPIRQTYSGWFEERLPFVIFRLPSWYQAKYPDKIENLRLNKNRLTSPYDVYHTLTELTRLGNRSSCERCSSLLQRIDKHRTCSDLRIAPNWCTCTEMVHLSESDPRRDELGQAIVRHIDAELGRHRDSVETGYRCANLTLSKVHSLQTNKNPMKKDKVATEMFIVQIETAPSNALFEATVVSKQGGLTVEGEVSRLNMYKEEGACLKDNTLRLLCYCVPE